jgi:hypothetical protein
VDQTRMTSSSPSRRGPRPARRHRFCVAGPPSPPCSLVGWTATFSEEVVKAQVTRLGGPVAIHLDVGLSESVGRDLPSIGQVIAAALVELGLIEDMLSIADLFVRWNRGIPAGQVFVVLAQTRAPRKRQGAAARARLAQSTRARHAAARVEAAACR